MAKRGLIVLIFIWALLLFVPAFKTQTQGMLRKSFSGELGQDNSLLGLVNNQDRTIGLQFDSSQLKIAELQTRSTFQIDQYWRDWDALLTQYPADLNARRARLVASTRKGSLVRPVYVPKDKAARAPSNEGRQWQNDAQRIATANAARVGEKSAPNDGFFPWMEAMALWNRDDEAALQALERAGQKSEFDDGVVANARAFVKTREQKFSMTAVDKLAVMFGALLPHFAQMRELSREVTWSGIEHYRRGDKAGAYRRWRIAMEAGGAMRRGQSQGPQSILIGLYVAQATQEQVWQGVGGELNAPARTNGVKPSQAVLLRAFESLARRDGQADLAAYAARENAAFEGHKFRDHSSDIVTEMGLYSPPTQAILQLPLISRTVAWLSVVGALGLAVCLLWSRALGGAHWYRASAAQIAFFGALWVGLLALATWVRAIDQAREFGGAINTPASLAPWLGDLLRPSWAFGSCLAATLLGATALCYWQKAREKRRLLRQIAPRHGTATAPRTLHVIIGLIWIAVLLTTIFWFDVAGDRDNAPWARGLWLTLTIVALALTSWQTERAQIPKKQSRLAIIGAICALAALGLAAQFSLSSYLSDATLGFIALAACAALAIAFYLIINAQSWRVGMAAALAISLQTLGGVAVICSIALLTASLVALPVRARQNRIVDDYIARGEIDWMRNQPELRRVGAASNKS